MSQAAQIPYICARRFRVASGHPCWTMEAPAGGLTTMKQRRTRWGLRIVLAGGVGALAFAALTSVGAAVSPSGAPAATGQYPKKVTICHKTRSKKNPFVTIRVSRNAVKAHLRHGDKIGPCSTGHLHALRQGQDHEGQGREEGREAPAQAREARQVQAEEARQQGLRQAEGQVGGEEAAGQVQGEGQARGQARQERRAGEAGRYARQGRRQGQEAVAPREGPAAAGALSSPPARFV